MRRRFKKAFAWCAFVLVLFTQNTAFCDEAYSNFGPGDLFNDGQAYAIGAFDVFENIHLAFQFTAEATGVIESVDAAFSLLESNGTDSVVFDIWSSETDVPDSLIWTGAAQVDEFFPQVVNGTVQDFTGGAVLNAGTEYWLSARSSTGTNAYGWFFNNQGDFLSTAADLEGGTNWTSFGPLEAGAFRVNVSAVPEPGSGILACMIALGTLRRSRRT